MSSSTLSKLDVIKKIPLFADLNEVEIREILKNSQTHNCQKGKTLFSCEEKSLNLYIVLSGVLKIFISDSEGEETVLQIADFGKSLNDIFNANFQSNAQALEDCSLLAIPLLDAREFLAKNLNFSSKILSDISAKNSELLAQLTQLKLTNAKQKVGQFLLGMAFEKSGDKEKNIELKCDKSVIASYLGIKSETLSRTLQKLKNDGEITVKKNQITLLQDNSLCDYCDSKIAAKCKQHQSSFCQDPHL